MSELDRIDGMFAWAVNGPIDAGFLYRLHGELRRARYVTAVNGLRVGEGALRTSASTQDLVIRNFMSDMERLAAHGVAVVWRRRPALEKTKEGWRVTARLAVVHPLAKIVRPRKLAGKAK